MPELPEVETVRRYLEDNIIGHKIMDVVLSNGKSLRNVPVKKLSDLSGQKIKYLDRKAKHLIIGFEKHYLILHLRMEGKLFVFSNMDEMEKNTNRFHDVMHIVTNKGIILFQDTRRFATIDMFDIDVTKEENSILSKVGPEPFDMSGEELFDKLNKKRTAIKSALLDQSIISGLGNIYVDEVLHSSSIHPESISNTITINECNDIIKHSRRILKKSIELKGTTIKSYTSQYGVSGKYQSHLKVHQQTICKSCGNNVIKIKVGGRGTYYCPNEQKITT